MYRSERLKLHQRCSHARLELGLFTAITNDAWLRCQYPTCQIDSLSALCWHCDAAKIQSSNKIPVNVHTRIPSGFPRREPTSPWFRGIIADSLVEKEQYYTWFEDAWNAFLEISINSWRYPLVSEARSQKVGLGKHQPSQSISYLVAVFPFESSKSQMLKDDTAKIPLRTLISRCYVSSDSPPTEDSTFAVHEDIFLLPYYLGGFGYVS